MNPSISLDSNPNQPPAFAPIDSQDQPTSSRQNTLTHFVFNFILSPIKAAASRLSSNTSHRPPIDLRDDPEDTHPDQSHHHQLPLPTPNHSLSHLFPQDGDQLAAETEPQRVMALLQESPRVDHLPQPQPTPFDTSLPTVFMPNFPSLSRPSQPPRSVSSLIHSRSAPSLTSSSRSRRSPSRTFYIGPGHSLMNPSTRLSMARRKRLGPTNTLPPLRFGYDHSSRHSEPPQPRDPIPEPVGTTPKRPTINDQPCPQNIPSNSIGNQAHTIRSTQPLPPRTIQHPTLNVIKNANVTPMRPSPLRNVTLPPSSPSPQRPLSGSLADTSIQSTPLPKKRKHRQADSIMSSVMKEVNLELQNRTPAPSPIKPSEVINPYADLQRPIRHKRPVLPPPAPPKNNNNRQESENRNRKVQVCLEGNQNDFDHPEQVGSQASNNAVENMLQETMPEEYRSTKRNNKSKRKTGHVGQLPERVLKKQRLREQQHFKSSDNIRSNTIDQLSPMDVPSSKEAQSLDDRMTKASNPSPNQDPATTNNNLLNSKTITSSSPIYAPAKLPSSVTGESSAFGSNSPNDASSSVGIDLNTKTTIQLNGSDSTPKILTSCSTSSLFPFKSAIASKVSVSIPISNPSITESTLNGSTARVSIDGHNDNHSTSNASNHSPLLESNEKDSHEGDIQESAEEEEEEDKTIREKVLNFNDLEMEKFFDQNLLVNFKFPTEHHLPLPVDNSDDDDFRSLKQTVLGFNSNELTSFSLL